MNQNVSLETTIGTFVFSVLLVIALLLLARKIIREKTNDGN